MNQAMVLKRFLSRVSPSVLLASTVFASGESKDEQKKNLVRARDLSIYSSPEKKSEEKEKEPKSESTLVLVVKEVREQIWALSNQVSQVTNKMNDVVETGKAHMSSSIQILRDEDNYVQRYGAIAAGGVVGYVVALRRGMFRRLIYSLTGASAVAAVCYPDQAEEYSSEGFRQTKRYVVIAYHFVNGVLRDYVGVQLPSLPGPLAIGSSTAAEKDASTVPTSATLMPPPASGPSHISSGPIPLPPIDLPSPVSDPQKKQGTDSKESSSSDQDSENDEESTNREPENTSFSFQDPGLFAADHNEDYSMYSRKT